MVEEIGGERDEETGEICGFVKVCVHTNIGTRYERKKRVVLTIGEGVTMERQGIDEETIEKLVQTSQIIALDTINNVMEKVRANTRTKRK
jgi:hypothetical protein